MSIEERLDLERQYYDHESTWARLAGRLKFACCRECGSANGMQAVHGDTLAEIIKIAPPISWYKEPSNAGYLFYPCPRCNYWRIIPNGYAHVSLDDIQAWLDHDPMAPDDVAPAEPEPVLASLVDRDSAGLEG